MKLFRGHNNNDFLKLSEEGRGEVDFITSLDDNTSEFRQNPNYEIIEQIVNDDDTINWFEELGFYEEWDGSLCSRSITIIENHAIQLIIPSDKYDKLEKQTTLTSGYDFQNLAVTEEPTNQFVVFQDEENSNYYQLIYFIVE